MIHDCVKYYRNIFQDIHNKSSSGDRQWEILFSSARACVCVCVLECMVEFKNFYEVANLSILLSTIIYFSKQYHWYWDTLQLIYIFSILIKIVPLSFENEFPPQRFRFPSPPPKINGKNKNDFKAIFPNFTKWIDE